MINLISRLLDLVFIREFLIVGFCVKEGILKVIIGRLRVIN